MIDFPTTDPIPARTDSTQQQQPAPTGGLSDEEYQNQAAAMFAEQQKKRAQQPVEQPSTEAQPSKVVGFFDNLRKTVLGDPAKPDPILTFQNDVGASVARGLAKTVQGVSNTADAVYDVTAGPILDKIFGPSKTPHHELLTDGEIDGFLGEKHTGVLGAVEDITQFSAGVWLAGELGIPSGGTATAKAALSAVKVGVGAAIAVDPYEHRLSSLVARGPSFISEPVKAFLVSNPETDAPIIARLKSGLENTLTAFAIDKFIGSVVSYRASKLATTAEGKAAALKLADVKYDAAKHGPLVVTAQEDGTALIEHGADVERRALNRRSTDADVIPTKESLTAVRKADPAELEFFQRRKQWTYDQFHAEYPSLTTTRAEWDAMAAEIAARPVHNLPYPSVAAAEPVAASMNAAIKNAQLPRGSLTDVQIKAIVGSGKEIAPQDLVMSADPAFDFSYHATPEQSAQTIAQIADRLPRTPGVQTHAETVAQAEGLLADKTGEQVVQIMRDNSIASEDLTRVVHAGDRFLKQQGNLVVRLGRALDATPDNAVAADELRKAVEHLVGVYDNGDALISNIGRALNAKQIATDGAVQGHEIMKATGKLIDSLKGWGQADFLAFARQVGNTEGGAQSILDLMRSQTDAAAARSKPVSLARQIMDKVNGIRMNAMLWGPVTHVTTLASNILTTIQRPAEVWWGGVNLNAKGLLVGDGWGQGSAMQQEGADMVAGVFYELKDALKAGYRAFQSGVNVLDAGHGIINDAASAASTNPITGIVGVAKLPERLLMTNDEIFKTLNYRSYVRAQSLRLSRAAGITDNAELGQRLAADMKVAFTAKGAATNPDALAWGRVATQQTPLEVGSLAQRYQSAAQAFPVLRLVTPFVRTPANLFNYAWERTPLLNLLQKSVREDFQAGGERAALALAKTQMGVALWGGTAMLAYDKTITGGGPLDPTLRQQWLAAGHQPYSIRVPGGWVSYARGNPVTTAVGIVADLVEMWGELPSGAAQEHAAMFVASIASNITNQTFMQGLSETLDAASDKSGRAATKFLISLETSFLPNITRQINPDDTLRETRGAIDELKSRIPGFSTTLEPRRNILGEPVVKSPGIGQKFWNPFTFMKPVDDHNVLEQMVSMGKAMAMPPERIGRVSLTDRDLYDNGKHQSPYDRMQQLVAESKDG
jgi:hypothetical protein